MHLLVILEHKQRPVFLCLYWAMARTSSHQNDHPAPSFLCGHPNRWKDTSRYKETGSLKSVSELTTRFSIPEPKTYPEPPECNWTDTKSTYPPGTEQGTHAPIPLTCAVIWLKAPCVVPGVVVAVPVALIRAARLSVVSRVESSVRNRRMETFTLSPQTF